MELNKENMKKIRWLIAFSVLLYLGVQNLDVVLKYVKIVWGLLLPFVLGGAMAFVLNVPMAFIERHVFGKAKEKGTKAAEKFARPVSLLLTLTGIVVLLILVMFGVIPQLTRTIGTLITNITAFIPQMQAWILEFSHNNQEIMQLVNQIRFDPDQAVRWGMGLLGKGTGNMMNTTILAVGSIVGIVLNAIMPGKDYVYGEDKQGDESVNFIVQ